MGISSEAYLAELAEHFLSGQTKIAWCDLARSALKGETIWIDPRDDQAGVEVEMNYRRLEDSVEIEVIACLPDSNGQPTLSVRRVGVVKAE